jgi:metal-sulfur cluster biosynthetic enzyme/nitrite reductase/ring-hydroxylating ferredoxin subunit
MNTSTGMIKMGSFVKICRVEDIPDPGKAVFELEGRVVVIFHVQGEWYCLEDVCTHDGGPLGEGTLTGHQIACPRHGAKFDVRSGLPTSMPATEGTAAFDVRMDDGVVYVSSAPRPLGTAQASGRADSSGKPDGAVAPPTVTPSAPANPSPDLLTEAESAPIAEDVIREKLKEVIDPELFINIIDLGLVYEIFRQDRDDGKTNVGIEMTMTSPACPAGPQLVAQSKAVVASLPGVGDVEIKVVLDPPWTPDRMTDDARDRLGIF